jgi:low temperature requirement protein LtrA
MFVAALAVPGAFGSDGVIFGVAFLIVAVVLVTLYTVAAAGNPDFLTAILRLVPWVLGGALLILVAGLVEGRYRDVFWIAALVAGFFGPALISVRGWRVQPGHFVERHGLIIIIAIGESLAAIGLGARGIALTGGVIMGAVLGFVVAASFWLAYFDFFSVRGRQLLATRQGEAQVELARDVYTYLHLPMVVGIVLFAFGMKGTLAHLHTPLGWVEAVALCGGSALYLGAYVALRYRVSRRLGRGRITAAIACALLVPVAHHVAALTALALLAAVWVGLHAYELIWWRVERAETRAQTT